MATEYKLFFEKTDSDDTEEVAGEWTWEDLEGAEKELAYQKFLGIDGLVIRSREVSDWS